MDIAPIKSHRDYRRALKEVEGLMHARRNSPEGDRLDVLVTLVEAWELSTTGLIFLIRWRPSNTIWNKAGCSPVT
jgi:antitoxin component HigA of HigAB toxin-antitoxin module